MKPIPANYPQWCQEHLIPGSVWEVIVHDTVLRPEVYNEGIRVILRYRSNGFLYSRLGAKENEYASGCAFDPDLTTWWREFIPIHAGYEL